MADENETEGTAPETQETPGAVAIEPVSGGPEPATHVYERNRERFQKKFANRVGLNLDEKTLSVREAMATALAGNMADAIKLLQSGTPMVRVRIYELFARYGLGEPGTISADAVRARILRTVEIIQQSRDLLTDQEADELVERIRTLWT